MRTLQDALIDVVERYSAATGTPLPSLGKTILNDTAFFPSLKDGRSCRLNTFEKIVGWLADNWPADLDWPSDIPRPSPVQEETT